MRRALLVTGALALAAAAAGCAGDGAAGGAPSTAPPAAPAPAPAGARSAGFVIVADAPSRTATASLPPGGTATVPLRLANASGSARTFALRSTVPWLRVPSRVSVPPRRSVPLVATARAGGDARPGVMRGDVSARPQARADARLAVVYESRVAVAVRVVAP